MSTARTGPVRIDLQHYTRLLLRQKWFIILPGILGIVLSALFSLLLPNQYRATSTVLVEPQSIPERYMSSSLPYGPETYVRSLVEQIKSRTTMERIIEEFNLYSELRVKEGMEPAVRLLRKRVSIERRGRETFSVIFTGGDPDVVRDVTNRITQLFIDENIKFRLERSQQNLEFLEKQASELRAQVYEQESAIQKYKAAHLDRLPEHRGAIQSQLNATNRQILANSEALAAARAKRAAIQERLERQGYVSRGVRTREHPDAQKLRIAKEKLTELKTRFSERHPDVKQQQREVEALEAELARAPRPTFHQNRKGDTRARSTIQRELEIADAEIARLEAESQRLDEQVETLTARLDGMPEIELELSELTRGLKVLRSQADAYQEHATDAAAALAMERGSQGSQFRALDRARRPEHPISPNRPLIIFLGALLGFGVGLFVVIVLDFLFRTFLDEQDLASFTGVQVLASIPQVGPLPSEWQRFRGQVSNLIGYLLDSLTFNEEYYNYTKTTAQHIPFEVPSGRKLVEGEPEMRAIEARREHEKSEELHPPMGGEKDVVTGNGEWGNYVEKKSGMRTAVMDEKGVVEEAEEITDPGGFNDKKSFPHPRMEENKIKKETKELFISKGIKEGKAQRGLSHSNSVGVRVRTTGDRRRPSEGGRKRGEVSFSERSIETGRAKKAEGGTVLRAVPSPLRHVVSRPALGNEIDTSYRIRRMESTAESEETEPGRKKAAMRKARRRSSGV